MKKLSVFDDDDDEIEIVLKPSSKAKSVSSSMPNTGLRKTFALDDDNDDYEDKSTNEISIKKEKKVIPEGPLYFSECLEIVSDGGIILDDDYSEAIDLWEKRGGLI